MSKHLGSKTRRAGGDSRPIALQHAASIASLLITTEAAVAEAPEKKKKEMPGGGGHGMEDYGDY